MSEIEFLSWVRGPGFTIATVIFVVGIIIRLVEMFMLGRKPDLAEARGSEFFSGIKTIFRRTLPDRGTFRRSTFTIVAGYIFHIGLFLTILFFAPHILLIKEVTGLSWGSLPTPLIDALTIISILALLAILVYRFYYKVTRCMMRFEDLLVWFVTIAPFITGYMAFHRIALSSPTLIGIHVLSVELLMIVFPFTFLMHTFTIFASRWYNGAIAGRRGVQS